MSRTIREEQLLAELQQRGNMTIKEIAEVFQVSEPTARRLCASVSRNSQAVRTHGGIKYFSVAVFDYSYDTLENINIAEKQRIARHAASMISDKDIIFLEGGTTLHHLALALAERLNNNDLKEVKVFTNSLNNLMTLSPLCKVTVVGGEYRPKRRDFVGYIAEKTVKNLYFQACFLGVDAIDLGEGMMATDIDTVRLDELLVTRSEKRVVLADSSKFNHRSMLSYAAIDAADIIITDAGIASTVRKDFLKNNINLVCV